MAISVEDDLILVGKIKKDPNKVRNNQIIDSSFSSTNSTDPMIQKLANELLALKKQISSRKYFLS